MANVGANDGANENNDEELMSRAATRISASSEIGKIQKSVVMFKQTFRSQMEQMEPCDCSRVGDSSSGPLEGFRCGPLLCG